MSIVTFIEARVADDETAPDLHAIDCQSFTYIYGEINLDRCDCGWPARVLREVAAKRATVARHVPDATCPTLRALASVWNSHAGYLAEWSVTG